MIIKILIMCIICIMAFIVPLLLMIGVTIGILISQEIERWWKYDRHRNDKR